MLLLLIQFNFIEIKKTAEVIHRFSNEALIRLLFSFEAWEQKITSISFSFLGILQHGCSASRSA